MSVQFPYDSIKEHQFWKKAFLQLPLDPHHGMPPKFQFDKTTKIASAGSCFAQRIAESLQDYGFNYYLAEPGPPWLSWEQKKQYSYGTYSARYGHIYTSLQLFQLLQQALGQFTPIEQYWVGDGCYYDPFRPGIQPKGFASVDELLADRTSHLALVKQMFEEVELFAFTLGLTETWCSRLDEAVYPVCPGGRYGQFDSERYYFRNLSLTENLEYMQNAIGLLKELNPKLKILLTVSPVPLVATMEESHVLQSTIYSKSVLRVVAEELKQQYQYVDYFASYEIITAPFQQSNYFESDCRTISREGIEAVMRCFYQHYSSEDYQSLVKVERANPSLEFKTKPCDEEELMRYIEKEG